MNGRRCLRCNFAPENKHIWNMINKSYYETPRVQVLSLIMEGIVCGSGNIYNLNYSETGEAGDINEVIDGGSF